MKSVLFVGEERSPTAIRMNVTWRDKKLCAGHLAKAVEAIGLDWDECEFKNAFEDDIEDIRSFDGSIVAMGRRVEKYLKRNGIKHFYIHHPAARGEIRRINNYIAHVHKQLSGVI